VTVHDPEWLEADTEAALEWAEYEASICTGCGHPRGESFDRKRYNAYTAEVIRCHACAAREREAETWQRDKNSDMAGAYFIARERPVISRI
jgi:hypothetical protein